MQGSETDVIQQIAAKAISRFMAATIKMSLTTDDGNKEAFDEAREDILRLGMEMVMKGMQVMRCDRVTTITYLIEDENRARAVVDRLDKTLEHAFKGISWICSGAEDFVSEGDGILSSEQLMMAGIHGLILSTGVMGEDKSKRSEKLAYRVDGLAKALAAALVCVTAESSTSEEELAVRTKQAARAIRDGIITATEGIESRMRGEHN